MNEYEAELFAEIAEAFGEDAEAIIASIICGQSADAAIQSLFIE